MWKLAAVLIFVGGLVLGSTGQDRSPGTQCGDPKAFGLLTPELNFGLHDIGTSSYPQTVTLCNTTDHQLGISRTPGDGEKTGDFVVNDGCGSSLAAHQPCIIGVSFRPTAKGDRSTKLTFKYDAGDSPQVLTLTGSGNPALVAEPGYFTFPAQKVGTSSSVRAIKITNYLGAVARITNAFASKNFTVDPSSCGELKDGASCVINVGFSPMSIGDLSGEVRVTYETGTASSTNPAPGTTASSPGQLVVTVQGLGVIESGFWSSYWTPYRSGWFSCIVALFYLAGIVITRWHMIARPNRNLLLSQITAVRSRLDAQPTLKAENEDFVTMLEAAEASVKGWNFWDFFFWTRGQESAAWGQVHEVELQLIKVTSRESARASLEVAEPELRHLGTPVAVALADKINEALKFDTGTLIEQWRLLLHEVSGLINPLAAILAAEIRRELARDGLRQASSVKPQQDLSARIDQALQAADQASAPALDALVQDILVFLHPDTAEQVKKTLETSPDFPADWEPVRKAILDFLASAMALTPKLQQLPQPLTLDQCKPLLQEAKDLLAAQNSVAKEIDPILSGVPAPSWSLLVGKAQKFLARQSESLVGRTKQALEESTTLNHPWKLLFQDISLVVTQDAITVSESIKKAIAPGSNASDDDLKSTLSAASDPLARQTPELAARIALNVASIPLARWRALLFEATQLIYDSRDTNYDSLASWQNKAIWLVGCGILVVVTLSAALPNAIFFIVGAAGGFLSRLARELKREHVPTDYGASWSTLFLSPVVGAIAGWAGLLLAIMLARLGILGSALQLNWHDPLEPVALGMAFLLGFSERAFDTVLSKLEDGIFKQATPAAPATAASTSLTILTDPKLPDGKVGQDYQDLKLTLKASGGTPDYTWSVSSGSSLPKDLVLDPNGLIHGKPASSGGPTKVIIMVTDKAQKTATKEFNITIAP